MNIVAPMLNQAANSKNTTTSTSKPHTMSAAELANQEMLQNMVQHQLLQSMLLQPMAGQFQGQIGANQMMSMPSAHQTMPMSAQLPVNQTMPFSPNPMGPSQLGMNQQTGVLNPQVISLMQARAMIPQFMPYLGGMDPNTRMGSNMGFGPRAGTSQLRLQHPYPTEQQSTAMSNNMPLLPGLLPLLNSLNMNQNSSATTDPKTSTNNNSSS